MNALLATLIAVIPNAILGVVAKLATEQFFQSVIERVLIAGLKKAAKMTTNTVDDEIVTDIVARLKTNKAGTDG